MAHRRLLDPNKPTYQINIYIETPLIIQYGSPTTEALVWLTRDSSEVIIFEYCVASGDFQADIRNFFAYRRLLLSLSKVLNATKSAWGDVADGWPMEKALDTASFNDVDKMWTIFETCLQDCFGKTRIPSSIRSTFGQKFEQESDHN